MKWLAVTSGQDEASVPNKFHNHPDHVLVRQKSKQLAGETTVPDSVISSCQIDKHGTSLLFCLKESSMFWVSKATWSTVDFPCRNPPCFFGSKGLTIGSTHFCRPVVRRSCKGHRAERWNSSSVGPLQV